MTAKSGRNGSSLRFRHRRDFLDHHALRFALSPRAAGSQPNHPERHDALRVDTKLRRFERYLDPGIEQGAPCRKAERTSRRTLVGATI